MGMDKVKMRTIRLGCIRCPHLPRKYLASSSANLINKSMLACAIFTIYIDDRLAKSRLSSWRAECRMSISDVNFETIAYQRVHRNLPKANSFRFSNNCDLLLFCRVALRCFVAKDKPNISLIFSVIRRSFEWLLSSSFRILFKSNAFNRLCSNNLLKILCNFTKFWLLKKMMEK